MIFRKDEARERESQKKKEKRDEEKRTAEDKEWRETDEKVLKKLDSEVNLSFIKIIFNLERKRKKKARGSAKKTRK